MLTFNRFNKLFFSLLGLLLAVTEASFATVVPTAGKISVVQELQVSLSGSPISTGATENLGSINLLSSSAPLTIVLENIGLPEDLTIGAISLTGANAGDFVLNTTGLVNTLGTGATTSFTITFSPTASGSRAAAIQIVSDDLNSPFVINLSGTGVKLNQTITFNALASKTYGDASFALGATASSSLPLSYTSDNLLVATISGNIVTIVGAGSANITALQAGDGTYNAALNVDQPFMVGKANLTVTADSKTKVFEEANPPLTFSYSSYVGSDNTTDIDTPPSISTTAVLGSLVGSYPITVSGGLDNNYSFTYVNAALTVSKATPLITWNNPIDIMYGTALDATQLNATSGGVAGTYAYTPALGTVLNAGVNQVLSVDFIPTDGINYNSVLNKTAQITVTKATPTITWNNPTDIAYGTALSATQLNATSGGVAGTYTYTPPLGTVLNVGVNQVLSVDFIPTDGINYNSVLNKTAQITVTKATPTITWNNPTDITYGTALGATQLNATSGGVAGTYTYTPPLGTVLNAGVNQVLSVDFIPTNTTNYNSVLGATAQIMVMKAPLSVSVGNQSRTYGAANPALTFNYAGFVNGENSSVINVLPIASTTAIATTNVGTYPINVSGGNDNNYDFVYLTGTLAITKATVTAMATNASRIYGGANPALVITYTGLQNGENSSVLDTPPTAVTLADLASDVGGYPITVSGGADNNYDFLYTAGTLTVTKATVTATADNKTRVYNITNPALTITYTGFVNGDNSSVLDVTATAATTAILSTSVGSYSITVAGGSDNNYNFNYVSGTLTITKATPIVSWAAPASIIYGTPLSASQLNATATVAGSFVYTPASSFILNVGVDRVLSVNFTPSDATNYNSVLGTTVLITVTKVTLTATANIQTRTYGAANPAFTINYTGFVNSENSMVLDLLPSAASAALGVSPVGNYPITVSGGVDNNYDFVYVAGTLTITKASITAIGVDANRLYGSANPTLSITYTGFLNGENASVIDTPPTASTTTTVLSNTGAYPIAVSGGLDNNYSFLYTAGTLTVTKATVTATATDATRVFGVANPSFTIVYSGFVNSETSTVLDVLSTASTTASLASSVGVYPITVSGGSDNNYSFNYVSAILTITKATPIISWTNPASITYGTPLGASQLNASSTVVGTFMYTPAIGSILNAGAGQVLSVNFTPSDLTNYNSVAGTTVTITVTKANPVITWANPGSIIYGTPLSGTQLNATASVSGIFAYTPGSGTILNAGANQVLSVNFTPTDGANYNSINGTTVLLTVNKATPTITWSSPSPITYGTALSATQLNATASVPGSFVYAPGLGTVLNAGANQSLSVNFTPTDAVNYNSVNGTTVLITVNKATPVVTWSSPAVITYGTALGATQLNATATVAGTFVYTPPSGTILNAGVGQVLEVNFTPSDIVNFNPVSGTTVLITVNKATPVITWLNPASIVYGTALSATQLNASANVGGTFVYTPTIGTLLNADANQTLSADFTPTDGNNYNSVSGVQRLITVTKATPVVTWNNPAAITYGTPLSATQLNATSNIPGTFVYSPATGSILNVGANQTLTLNFAPADAVNYSSVIGKTVLITVNKATPIVTWNTPLPIKVIVPLTVTQLNATANVPGTFTYTPPSGTTFASAGTYPLSVSFTPTDASNYNTVPSTQVQLDVNSKDNPIITWASPTTITYGTILSSTQLNATANVPGTFVYTPASGTLLNAGANQTLSVNFMPTDGVNYNAINRSVQISVNKATVTATAISTSRVYGASNPSFIINYSGFVNSENASVIDTAPTASCSAIANDNAGGVFPIIPSGGVDNNYSFAYVNGSLTITKAALTAKADDKSRSYGLSNPTFTISYTGFVNGDTQGDIVVPSASSIANASSNVGSYPITLSGGSSVNYNISLQPGALTVNISPLIARASDLSKTYGQTNPTLTIVYAGFLNGDNVGSITQPIITTTAVTNSNVGAYAINLSGGSAINYGIILQSGTMTINKTSLTISASNQTRLYGAANPAFTLTYAGFVNGENASVIDSPTIASTPANVLSPTGSYTINVSGGSDNNYNLINATGTLTITKVSLTATVANATRVYGAANPTFTINYSGFVNGENSAVIDQMPGASTSATTASGVGTYPVNASGGTDNNYNFVYVGGTLTITKATLVATALDSGRPYGVPNPTFVINYTGFVNGETVSVINSLPTATTTAIVASPIGNYPITVSGGFDNNYAFTYVNGILSVGKSNPIITWNNPSAISFGTPLSGTQLNASANVPGTFTYTPSVGTVLNAGANQVLSANFNPTDAANFNPINGITVVITVNKATPVVTWASPAAITFGTPLTATQLNATANVPGTFSYTPPGGTILDAGANQVLSVNFIPTNATNYNTVNGTTVLITVNKATPVVTWSSPSAITYGTALGGSQLNASANVPGTFTYSPVAGTILNAGANQTLSVNFTPTNSANYNSVTNTTTQITVNKANPIITWASPAAIAYGTPLSTAQLNAVANTTGAFTYTPASGVVLNAGSNQVLSVNFTPANLTNFNIVTGTTTLINVNKATPGINWANPAAISYGTPLGTTQLNATASVPGTFLYTPAATTILNAGANQILSVDFTPSNTANYNAVAGKTALITVNKINLTAKADNKSRVYGLTNPTLSVTYTGFVIGEIQTILETQPSVSTAATVLSNVGDYPITISGGVDNNYNFTYTAGLLAITKATLTVTADDKSRLLATPNPPLTISYSGFVNLNGVADLDVAPIASSTATLASPLGGYSITVSGGSDNNYSFVYVPGTLTINPNFPPTLNNFQIVTAEDQQFNFSYSIFEDNFTSFSGSSIVFVKIVSLPSNGVLFWNGSPLTTGAEVTVENGSILNFIYTPTTNFNGSDSFKWNASDGSFMATESATISVKIEKVNDAPTLSNIETQPILYSLGDAPVVLTQTTVINDVDDNLVYSARISIAQNFAKGDLLALGLGASVAIISAYDATTGELTLSGKDSRANYEAALTKVVFSSPVSGDAIISDKLITIAVKDSSDFSSPVSRVVSITEVFPELSIVNAFTPNDDGVNDYWDFGNLDFYSTISIMVFDRNGAKVYSCESKDCKWDGKLGGKTLPPGPYFYTIYLNGGKRKYQGTVTLLR